MGRFLPCVFPSLSLPYLGMYRSVEESLAGVGRGLCGAVGPGVGLSSPRRATLPVSFPLLSAGDAATHPCRRSDPAPAPWPWSISGSTL